MIVIDTNVISEVMKTSPSLAVLEWLNQQNSNSLFVSTITLGEIEYGLRILPTGKRRHELKERFEQFIFQAFRQRILVFDEAAARSYGEVMGHRKDLGRPMSVPDGQIAAIARSKGFAIATRNTSDFEECGFDLFNPFLY
ncbi:MAG: VapC toxin family PIN domain ribonuclease [Candidatus Methylumidiphilus alinenensis]|uniref:Ribonuclease VapC n=1 Tax=Candidatus Methylumidiphilus alinenensis TaxID=2202197 RepID=A0A2W4S674_9GAMM|nr:MAG: VapC toxin family PIN domain ribonuclease [Candidatus Methylumidiphilus alinenensis]